MSDFTVNIDSTLDLSKAESQMSSFLNKYKSTPLKVDVQLDTKSINPGNLGKQIQDLINNSVKGIKINGLEVGAVDFAKQKQKMQEIILNTSKEMEKSISSITTKDSNKWATQYVNQQQKEYQKIINTQEKFQSNLQQSQERYNSLKNKDISKYSDTAAYAQIESNLERIKKLQSNISSLESKNDSESIIRKNSALKEMNSLLGKSETAYNNLVKPIGTFEAITDSNKTTAWIKNNTKAMKEMGAMFDSLAQKQANATTKGEREQYKKEFQSLVATAQSKGLTGKSWFGEFKRAGSAIAQFTGIYGVLQRIPQTIGSAVTELKEMDSILTEISKVSDMTDIQLQKLGKDSFDYASQYGKKVTDYLQGVTEMNRSGFYGQQGIDLANTSVLAQAAGDMNADVANSYLLATNAAYEYAGSAKKLNDVLDGQNMITNRNSVNMVDMAEATSKAASMAAQTGVQVNELSAIIGTAVARTKQEGNVIGTSLKSLFVNLQDTSNKKIVGTFEDLGISQTKFINGSEQLKTPIELLRELADAYNNLPEGSTLKADVLRNIGNKRQANVLAAVLAGIGSGDYDKMLQDYSQGGGSAAREAEKSAQNWEGSLNRLSNSWTEFISNFANAGQITSGINLINSLVQAFDSLIEVITPLGVIGAGAGITAFFKNLDEPINHRVPA